MPDRAAAGRNRSANQRYGSFTVFHTHRHTHVTCIVVRRRPASATVSMPRPCAWPADSALRAVESLDAARTLGDGDSPLVFPSVGRQAPLLRAALHRPQGARDRRCVARFQVELPRLGGGEDRPPAGSGRGRAGPTWSATRSKRPMPARTCSSGGGCSWTIGRSTSPARAGDAPYRLGPESRSKSRAGSRPDSSRRIGDYRILSERLPGPGAPSPDRAHEPPGGARVETSTMGRSSVAASTRRSRRGWFRASCAAPSV